MTIETTPIPVMVIWNDASEQTGKFSVAELSTGKAKKFQFVGFLAHYDDSHVTFVSHVDVNDQDELHNRFDLPWDMIERLVELDEGEVLFDASNE